MLFAIAIIVVASLLGAAMMRMLRIDQEAVARDVLSTRALLAADSAAQRAMNRIFVGGTTPSQNCSNIVNGSSITFTVDGLRNCSATITCVPLTAPASVDNYYTVRATGRCGPVGDEATRQVEVLARDVPTT